jgi:hypothetical protein
MFSNTNMQLTIKIPEDDIKMAALKAIQIMREVRDGYLQEGNLQFASELVTPKSVKSSPANSSPVFEPPPKPKKEFKRSLSWKDSISEAANLCDFRMISPRKQQSPTESNSPKETLLVQASHTVDKLFTSVQSINITEKLFTSVKNTLTPKVQKEENFEI